MFKHLTSPFLICCLALSSLYLFSACASTGDVEVDAEWDIPLGPKIKYKYKGAPAPGTGTVEGLPPGKCLKTTFTDEEGNELPGSPVFTPIDDTGTASGPIPEGAVRQQSSVTDCPPDEDEEEEEEEAEGEEPVGGGMFDPSWIGRSTSPVPSAPSLFHFFGGDIVPDDTIGAENLSYSITVVATTQANAEAVVNGILAGGIGGPVPNSAYITRYNLTIPTVSGARMITANPDGIDEFTFDLNQGAHYADLASGMNVLTYTQGSWDVVETVAPLSAFNNAVLPGASYANHADFSWSTSRFAAISTGQVTLSGTIN